MKLTITLAMTTIDGTEGEEHDEEKKKNETYNGDTKEKT